MATKHYETLARRAAREREYGVTCYEYQAMVEVDHPDWQQHSAEMAQRRRDGIAYSADEADFAAQMVREWIGNDGASAVVQQLSDIINARRAEVAA